jgi:predicted nuclease of predicted toxin-antitoxin system
VRFLIDRCAGHRLADWRRTQGHDVVEVSGLGPDPGDDAIIAMAAREGRVLVTIDTDFGRLIHGGAEHAGLIRLPDVPAGPRILLLADVLRSHTDEVAAGAVVTVRSGRIRISRN